MSIDCNERTPLQASSTPTSEARRRSRFPSAMAGTPNHPSTSAVNAAICCIKPCVSAVSKRTGQTTPTKKKPTGHAKCRSDFHPPIQAIAASVSATLCSASAQLITLQSGVASRMTRVGRKTSATAIAANPSGSPPARSGTGREGHRAQKR